MAAAPASMMRSIIWVASGRPSAPIGPDGCGVRDCAASVEADLRDRVDALGHRLGEGHEHRTDARVGARVADDVGVEADDRAVALQAQLGVHDEAATLDQRQQVLGAVLGPFHRPAQLLGGSCGKDVLDIEGGLGAEPSADPRGDDPHVCRVEGRARPPGPAAWSAAPGSTGGPVNPALGLVSGR